jgi:hypothetical protein
VHQDLTNFGAAGPSLNQETYFDALQWGVGLHAGDHRFVDQLIRGCSVLGFRWTHVCRDDLSLLVDSVSSSPMVR